MTRSSCFVFAFFLSLCHVAPAIAQSTATQTIRGRVTDVDSGYPIIGASVFVPGSDPLVGTVTDVGGYFELKGVPYGRQPLRITAVGYDPVEVANLLVMAGKELQSDFEMKESLQQMDEVVISAGESSGRVSNELAVVSARVFDPENTARFAGSRNDPARMATNFAGVSGANDSRNDVIIRGNSPAGVLWRLEGIDIPSPNHFSSFGSTGGPVSMLNYNVLGKSDFITSAFPAEYGNAVAGVFDLKLRAGNKGKREYLGQIGFNGFEFGAEGPFSANSNASYLINYRYSTLGVFKALGMNFGTGTAVPQYQDLNYMVDIPTGKSGKLSFWGLAGVSSIELLGSEKDSTNAADGDFYGSDGIDIYNKTRTAVTGLSHTYFFNKNTFSKISLAASHQLEQTAVDSISIENRSIIVPAAKINNRQNKYTAHLMVNTKLSARHTLSSGLIADLYAIQFADSAFTDSGWVTINDGEGQPALARAYSTWQARVGEKITINSGLHVQYFGLNGSSSLEPRFGAAYQFANKQSLNIGLSIHNQLQPLPTYYIPTDISGVRTFPNKEMDFTRSKHLVLGYDYRMFANMSLKVEAYYQQLDQAPVERFPSSFSLLNSGADFGTPNNGNLVNNGEGKNYGLELTLEKYYSQQSYFLLTTSLFDSKYKASDGIWRNTAFNSKYVVNLLGGKEWNIGSKANALITDIKGTLAGGRFYSPVDLARSADAGQAVYMDAYSAQYDNYFRADLKVAYRMNKKRITQEWGVEIQNITNRKNVFMVSYNPRSNTVNTEYQLGLFPVPQYRILF